MQKWIKQLLVHVHVYMYIQIYGVVALRCLISRTDHVHTFCTCIQPVHFTRVLHVHVHVYMSMYTVHVHVH